MALEQRLFGSEHFRDRDQTRRDQFQIAGGADLRREFRANSRRALKINADGCEHAARGCCHNDITEAVGDGSNQTLRPPDDAVSVTSGIRIQSRGDTDQIARAKELKTPRRMGDLTKQPLAFVRETGSQG